MIRSIGVVAMLMFVTVVPSQEAAAQYEPGSKPGTGVRSRTGTGTGDLWFGLPWEERQTTSRRRSGRVVNRAGGGLPGGVVNRTGGGLPGGVVNRTIKLAGNKPPVSTGSSGGVVSRTGGGEEIPSLWFGPWEERPTTSLRRRGGGLPGGVVNRTAGGLPGGVVNRTGGGLPGGVVNRTGGGLPGGVVNRTGGGLPGGVVNRTGGEEIPSLFPISFGGNPTGATIVKEGSQRRRAVYYSWRGGCYTQDRARNWHQVDAGFC